MSSGRAYTRSVRGWYWMSSSTSLRNTTEPSVVARLPPTVRRSTSTWLGNAPLCRT
jgi:hypothetical protein